MKNLSTAFVTAGTLALSSTAFALEPDAFRLDKSNPFAQIQTALQTIQNEPQIRVLMQDRANTLMLNERISGKELETTKFRHFFQGIEVIGSMAFFHQGRFSADVRNALKTFDLDINPTLSPENAFLLAKSLAGERSLLSPPSLKILPSESSDSARLIYWIELEETVQDGARDLLIDAHTGEVLANLSKHLEIAPIQIYSAARKGVLLELIVDSKAAPGQPALQGCKVTDLATGKTRKLPLGKCGELMATQCQVLLDGAPVAIRPQACNLAAKKGNALPFADLSSRRALQNSMAAASYYLSRHGRDSFDGRGSPMVSVVHAGLGYANAHWDIKNKHMVYGDGDGVEIGDFTLALDVAGHEMTHGVISHTSNLLPMGEAGALNEAYADFFGKMIEGGNDWMVGKKLFLRNTGGKKGIRDLARPANLDFQGRPYPDHVSNAAPIPNVCDQTNDACWVHLNATIPGHASYLVVNAIGRQKAEILYYSVLTQGIAPRDGFKQAGAQTRLFCRRMFDKATCAKVDAALAKTGM
ncbi:MAG: M4 family metallopeptidase [Oligoflexia bacterium]|nr:M4 family metallopeptidase [Oligoflexia bacterium]